MRTINPPQPSPLNSVYLSGSDGRLAARFCLDFLSKKLKKSFFRGEGFLFSDHTENKKLETRGIKGTVDVFT